MYIECAKPKGRSPYLRVSETYTETKSGVTKIKKRIIKNIGPLPKYDDGKPEYVKRLKESFKAGEPLIAGLEELARENPTRDIVTIRFDRRSEEDKYTAPKNMGYMIIEAIYNRLGINEVLRLHKSRAGITYDLNGLSKMLVIGRVMRPESKRKTHESKGEYIFEVTKSANEAEIYWALDSLHEKSEGIQKRMNLKIGQAIGRNTEVCYYDVTNYYFEINENDGDITDERGKVMKKGLRKKGVSKEKRSSPIVQMGLFMDDNGIPISYQLFTGSDTDTTTLRPAMKKTIDSMKFGRVIIVADGGLNSGPNIGHILGGKNGYIVSKSTKKSDKNVKAWILDESGYIWNKEMTFKVKSQIRDRTIKCEDGTPLEIREKLVCFWSRKHYEKERHENKKFIEYLETVIAYPDKLKDGEKKIEKFLKKVEVDKSTGEVVNTATQLWLDMDKIQAYLDLMGYYTIMTSEIEKSDEEIISKYHGLSRIEDSFRITKSDLEGRPVFVSTPEHINAHFLTCFIALTIIRLIQHKILLYLGKNTNSSDSWDSGLSAVRIQNALNDWFADALPSGFFR
ncbi:MAG: IS1634 family transposase, partial [Oscillospiraceae bacterium]|nr:IS1634 family transposase [Oscillospiraceae bacterium]